MVFGTGGVICTLFRVGGCGWDATDGGDEEKDADCDAHFCLPSNSVELLDLMANCGMEVVTATLKGQAHAHAIPNNPEVGGTRSIETI